MKLQNVPSEALEENGETHRETSDTGAGVITPQSPSNSENRDTSSASISPVATTRKARIESRNILYLARWMTA